MDKFDILHKYNILVRRDIAVALTCTRDGSAYVVRLNDEVTPLLQCFGCGNRYFPSDREYDDLQKIVETKLK